jgi:hypothetical protein
MTIKNCGFLSLYYILIYIVIRRIGHWDQLIMILINKRMTISKEAVRLGEWMFQSLGCPS